MDPPTWINEKLFESALQKFFKNDSVKLLDSSCKLAIPAGENYTTYVFRVNATFVRNNGSRKANKETKSIIVKCMREGVMIALAEELNLFKKETDMFVNVLPQMEKAYGNVKRKNVLSADCLDAASEPNTYIIIQDLCPLGFRVHERRNGLDKEHAIILLEKMAILHASSYAACKQNPKMLKDIYSTGLYSDIASIQGWVWLGFDMLKELSATCKDFARYKDKFEKITHEIATDRCLASWRRIDGDFCVLNHGDSWVNNMMFSYDENGKPIDCRYLDFQLCVYTSPSIDLHYFFSTSLANNVIDDIDALIDFYYIQFLVALNKINQNLKEVPSLKQLKQDFRDRAFYGLTAIATVLPLVRAEGREDANFDDLLSDNQQDGFRYHCYNNDTFKGALIRLLPIYEKFGVFD